MTNKKIWDSWESNIHEQEASKKRIISAKQSILTPYFYKKLIGIFMKRKIFLMLLVFSATSFLYACGNSNPMYQPASAVNGIFIESIEKRISSEVFFCNIAYFVYIAIIFNGIAVFDVYFFILKIQGN